MVKLEGKFVERVKRRFYARGAAEVARELIGLYLVHRSPEGMTAGRIVEVEAYLSRGDEASHSYSGPTSRNAAMFGPCGHAYVYFVYGVHHCFNVVTGPIGSGEAVLVRAVEPVEGLDLMCARRGRARNLCDGPGKLVEAFGIRREHDGADLARGPLGLWRAGTTAGRARVRAGPRIGITKSVDLPLRFVSAEEYSVAESAASRRAPSSRSSAAPRRPSAAR